MNDKIIINKYASAAASAFPETELQHALEDLNILRTVFTDNQKIINLLQSHLISKLQKNEIIEQITGDLHQKSVWQNLFLLLISNFRFTLILHIISATRKFILAKQDKINVSLKFAQQQDEETVSRILEYLKKVFHKNIVADIEYDKSIIGGFTAETEDMVIDGSIQNNLKRFIQASCKKSN
ncbi:MAG: ATP synthase F1 subunit delta [Candidatus Cloacimonetes bacterium]|nr:ATP synthase F1 subunit delta [Candidatus Cloacimonadota bacterium]